MDDSLGKKIKHLRKTLDLTQNDLSCEILSRSILSKIETDKVTPSIYQLNYLATKLNVTTDILLNETLDDIINRNEYITSTHIHKLFCEKLYLDIISTYETKKSDFLKEDVNLFYLGISYYNIHFYKEAINFLKKYINYVNKLDYDDPNKNIHYFIKSINILASIYFDNNQSVSYTHLINYLPTIFSNNNLFSIVSYNNLFLINTSTSIPCTFKYFTIRIIFVFFRKFPCSLIIFILRFNIISSFLSFIIKSNFIIKNVSSADTFLNIIMEHIYYKLDY